MTTETPAETFDRLFLPAMAGPWAERVADAAALRPGDRVLDVACGTGAVAAEAARRVAPSGAVAGLYLSPDMLAVARRKLPGFELREGRAEALPFDDYSFDAVLCQFGLMFFDDRARALREMRRVLRPGGRVVVAVWDGLDRSPGYAALAASVERCLGPEVARPIRDSFALGDVAEVRSLLDAAGFAAVSAASVDATARFPSLRDWVDAEVRGWVGTGFTERDYAVFVEDAQVALRPYEGPDGSVEFTLPAIVGTGSRP
jgi:SAM-dependent methyltransferase